MQQIAWGAACGLMLLAAAQGTARAEDDDDQTSIWNLDTKLYQGLMSSLGWRNGSEQNNIDYHERSPLVLPPSRDLPAPEVARTQPSAAWPVDPDQKKRKAAAAAKAKRKLDPYDPDKEAENLMPSELNRGGAPAPGSNPGRNANDNPNGTNLPPSKLGYFGGLFSWSGFGLPGAPKDEVGTFTKEPPRAALTAPPPGYQTPSPDQPYGVTKRAGYGPVQKKDLAVGDLGY